MSAFNKIKSFVGGKSTNPDTHRDVIFTDADPVPTEVVEQVIERARQDAQTQIEAREAREDARPEPPVLPSDTDASLSAAPTNAQASPAPQISAPSERNTSYMPHTSDLDYQSSSSPSPELAPMPVELEAPRALGPTRKTDNLSHIRSDLAALNEDMSTGEQFYAQSLKRINNLINYAYETEANLSALEHLEPENQRLRVELDEARQKANDEIIRAESLKSKAAAYETRYLEARQSLEKAQLALTQMEDEKSSLARDIADKELEIAGLTNSNRTIRNELAVDRQTQEKLSAKNLSLSSELSVAMSEKLELEKRSLELNGRLEKLSGDKIELERVVAQTRQAHKATEEHNIALKAEIEQVLADVQVFKQQFDTTNRNRGAEINALRAKVSDLETEVSIKTDVVTHAHDEMAELRQKYDTAHRGRRKLLDHIESQKLDTDRMRDLAEAAKSEARTYGSQIISLQAELDELRRLNAMQSDKLKKYMALNTTPVSAEPKYPMRASVAAQPIAQDLPPLRTPSTERVAPTQTPPAHAETTRKAPPKPVFEKVGEPPKPEPKAEAMPGYTPIYGAKAAADTPEPEAAAPAVERRGENRPFQQKLDAQLSAEPVAAKPVAPQDSSLPAHDGRQMTKANVESARYGMVGGISSAHGMGAKPAESKVQSPQPVMPETDDTPTPNRPKTEAEQIEDTLMSLHDLDLLEEAGRVA